MFDAMITDDEGKRVPLVRFDLSLLPISLVPLPWTVQAAMKSEAQTRNWSWRVMFSGQAVVRSFMVGIPAFALLMAFICLDSGALLSLLDNPWLLVAAVLCFFLDVLVHVSVQHDDADG